MAINKNIRYAIITRRGFILDKQINSTALYSSAHEAMKNMPRGSQLVPIHSNKELIEYETEKKRLPSLNRFGRT